MKISARTIDTMTPPLMPSLLVAMKSGVLEPKVAKHMSGATSKPAQIALNTDNDSN